MYSSEVSQITNKVRKIFHFKQFNFFGLLFVLTIVGLANFRKFGISWEAPGLRLNGGNAAIYIADKFGLNVIPDYYRQFPPMGENGMADHGVAYDLPLVVLERVLGISDSMQIYHFRSLINFCIFIVGSYAVFLLAKRRFDSSAIGLLAASFFVLSPRIFAAGFYSPSDMVFASIFAVGANLSIKLIQERKILIGLYAGMVFGYATDIRLLGIIALPTFVVAYLIENFGKRSYSLKPLVTFVASYLGSIYIFFPYLWENPIARFLEVFRSLSKYNWGGTNLYFGEQVSASELPWHYIPVWIAITTPFLYLVLFLIGSMSILHIAINSRRIDFNNLQDYIFIGLVIAPISMVIILNSVLYDSWRHLFFIYPFFILVAIHGWVRIYEFCRGDKKKLNINILVTFIFLSQVFGWMVANNSRQYLYFNFLAGHSNLQEKWEMDYLGLSNADVIQDMLQDSTEQQLNIGIGSFTPFDMSLKIVPEEFRDRIRIVPIEDNPEYIVNNFRIPSSNLGKILENYTLEKKYSIDQSIYFEIWKLKQ